MVVTEDRRAGLQFSHMDDVTGEIERLARGEVRANGKHSFAEIVRHLAIANEMVIGQIIPPKPPLLLRLLLPFIRNSILNGPVKPGFKLSADAEAFFWPSEPVELQDAIARFKTSVQNYKEMGPLPIHPIFGKATPEQIDRLMLAHAAMHLSFVHPHNG